MQPIAREAFASREGFLMPSFWKATPLAMLFVAGLSACSDQVRTPTAAEPSEMRHYTAPAEPVNGEFIRQTGDNTVWLVFNRTLYGVPDPQTLRACTAGRELRVRQVSYLPSWSRQTLPSAGDPSRRPHGRVWMHGDRPVQGSNGTVWLVEGCVKSGIPSADVYSAIFNGDWSRIVAAADADLNALPTGPIAQPIPLRRAGTLLESNGTITWVTYHGGSLGVPDPATMDSYCRPWSDMISGSAEYNAYPLQATLQPGLSSGCLRGNDYPYVNSAMGYADAWSFITRNCTSFAAWRLNQDGIEFWNYYGGPHWGNADNWDDAARSLQSSNPNLGVRVDKTPKRGAIAQWNSNHVAFVAAVHNDGYITIEEYNNPAGSGLYNSRRIPASNVDNYIHFRSDS
jgi:surface antigen